jgi:hypothetical protein
MPARTVPLIVCQTIHGTGKLNWSVYNIPTDTFFRDSYKRWADGGYLGNFTNRDYSFNLGTVSNAGGLTFENEPPQTGGIISAGGETAITPADIAAARVAARAALEAGKDWLIAAQVATPSYTFCIAEAEESEDASKLIQIKFNRFRWRIGDDHAGTYFKITYDIAEFPLVGAPGFVSQDNVTEWTGPGSGAQSDPSWLTPWVEIPPPTAPGERRVVNVRYSFVHGSIYGVKPQVWGEAL